MKAATETTKIKGTINESHLELIREIFGERIAIAVANVTGKTFLEIIATCGELKAAA